MKNFKPKACARCGEQFVPRSGFTKYCDACKVVARRVYSRRHYLKHRDEILAYYQEHRDEILAYNRKYRKISKN